MSREPLDAQEIRFRIAQLRLEVMEFRRLLKHATMNVVTMEKVVEEGDLSEPEPRERYSPQLVPSTETILSDHKMSFGCWKSRECERLGKKRSGIDRKF